MSSAVLFRQRTAELDAWLALRRERGADRFDEVWEGTYVVNPAPRVGHAKAVVQLYEVLKQAVAAAGLEILHEVNIGARDDFRIPDVTVLDAGVDLDLVYVPSATIVVEVLSPDDGWDDKLPFYFRRGVREAVVVDRREHSIRWFVAGPDGWVDSERSEVLGIEVADVVAAVAWP